jgi:DNA ligase-1
MYAQRGSGKRLSFDSRSSRSGAGTAILMQAQNLPAAAKPTSGSQIEGSGFLDRRCRGSIPWRSMVRFGKQYRSLVFEVAFDLVHISKRHKSGVAMRFPRIHRIRQAQTGARQNGSRRCAH